MLLGLGACDGTRLSGTGNDTTTAAVQLAVFVFRHHDAVFVLATVL